MATSRNSKYDNKQQQQQQQQQQQDQPALCKTSGLEVAYPFNGQIQLKTVVGKGMSSLIPPRGLLAMVPLIVTSLIWSFCIYPHSVFSNACLLELVVSFPAQDQHIIQQSNISCSFPLHFQGTSAAFYRYVHASIQSPMTCGGRMQSVSASFRGISMPDCFRKLPRAGSRLPRASIYSHLSNSAHPRFISGLTWSHVASGNASI